MKILINKLVMYWVFCTLVKLFIILRCNTITVFHLLLFHNVLTTYDSSLHNSGENCWLPLALPITFIMTAVTLCVFLSQHCKT